MSHVIILFLKFITAILQQSLPGGVKAVAIQLVLLEHQLYVVNRGRKRAPHLTSTDRLIFGFCSIWMSPKRIARSAIIVKPATILKFHRALVEKKYRLLFSQKRKSKPGPKGPSKELIDFIVEIKKRNPSYGCKKIALLASNVLETTIDEFLVRRILSKYYYFPKSDGPSWLTFIGQMKDSLWSLDLFRCESIRLQSYWILLIMDQYTRRIIGFAVHKGDIDAPTLCYLFNKSRTGASLPKHLSTDNDPLFVSHRWKATLSVLDVEEIKTVPYTPISHPFIERLIGTTRREFLDHTLFWNQTDLERKLQKFADYYNNQRVHYSLEGKTPSEMGGKKTLQSINLKNLRWQSACNDLYQIPVPA